jgi:hypothetical protein
MRVAVVLFVAAFLQNPSRPADVPFTPRMIDGGASETAAVADINRDGRADIVSGEYWYEAPAWTKHRFREVGFSGNYIDSFSVLPIDVDADGYVDIADVSWFARRIAWWRNPGASVSKTTTFWTQADVNACCNVEFALLADMNNDGKAQEIVAQENGTGQAWYEVRNRAWVRHAISDRTYGHGIGAGDVNGDGRNDILTPRGWIEAPLDPTSPNWTFHNSWEGLNVQIPPAGGSLPPPAAPAPNAAAVAPAPAAPAQPAQPPRVLELGFMHVVDVNADGRNDVLAAAGHDYGVFWFEQGPNGQWTRRTIDAAWSQGHASTLVDLNGDGRKDLVTGKRFMAHNGTDPGEREPLGLYWYEFRPVVAPAARGGRGGGPSVEWIRHVIEYGGRIGAGMQIAVSDVDADQDLDLVVAGKSGLFLLENGTSAARPRRQP